MAQPVVPTPYAIPPFFVYASLEGEARSGADYMRMPQRRYGRRRLLQATIGGHFLPWERIEEIKVFLSSHAFRINLYIFALSRMESSGILRSLR